MPSLMQIQTLGGVDYSLIQFGNLLAGTFLLPTVRVKNIGTTTATAVRLTTANYDWTYAGKRNDQGQEAVTRKFVEAKIGDGAWTPIGGVFTTGGNYIAITPPAAGAYVDVQLRMVIPTDAATKGSCKFVLCGAKSDA